MSGAVLDSPDLPAIHPRVWDIIGAIDEDDGEGVIPIVGQGLLTVQSRFDEKKARAAAGSPEIIASVAKVSAEQSGPGELHSLLARAMAHRLGLPDPMEKAASQLANVVALHPKVGSNRYLVDTELLHIYHALDVEVPLALRQLASIQKLNFFISTTGDDLLERALNEERFKGDPLTRVLAFAPTRRPAEEKIAEAIASGYPVVFHLFGRYKNPGCVAVTESDYVDFIAALLDHEMRPRRLFAELKGKHLLLLGNSFQDWLARFFLRLAKDTPFIDQSGGVQYVADSEVNRDKQLAFFLQHCAKKAEPIADIDPPALVTQLAASWAQRQQSKHPKDGEEQSTEQIGPDWIMISYARRDLSGGDAPDVEWVKHLAGELKRASYKVWVDIAGGLRGGDDYARTIRHTIDRCGLFLPICSKTTHMRGDSEVEDERPFFRREWDLALQRQAALLQEDPDRKFIIPIVVDDLPFDKSNVPAAFKKLHCTQLREGVVTKEFLDELKNVIRAIKRRAFAAI